MNDTGGHHDSGHPGEPIQKREKMNKKKLFIGNLHYSVTEGQIRKLLSGHGDVIGVKLMEGKGYAFVEMGTEEQAGEIQRTLSESVFEGRKLLIDGVPGKRNTGRSQDRNPRDSPGTRQEYTSDRDREPGVHHLEAYERPPQSERMKPVFSKTAGKPSIQKHNPDTTGSVSEKGEKPKSRSVGQLSSAGTARTQRSDRPVNGQQQPRTEMQKSGASEEPRRESARKPERTKPKTIKAKPPKNPHPYQGSKKSKKPEKSSEDRDNTPESSSDTEKKDFLRHWATLAGRKEP